MVLVVIVAFILDRLFGFSRFAMAILVAMIVALAAIVATLAVLMDVAAAVVVAGKDDLVRRQWRDHDHTAATAAVPVADTAAYCD